MRLALLSKLSFLNPFRDLIESNQHKTARLKRSSLGTRKWDAFYALHGKIPFVFGHPHFGLFDYATLGLSFFIDQAFVWVENKSSDSKLASIGLLILMPLAITLELLRLAVTGIAMIPAYPIIRLLHWILSKKNQNEINSALAVENSYPHVEFGVGNHSGEVISRTNVQKSLGKVLEERKMTLDDLEASWDVGTHNDLQFHFHEPIVDYEDKPIKAFFMQSENDEPESFFEWKVSLDELPSLRNKHAFFKLNVGGVEGLVETLIERNKIRVDNEGKYHLNPNLS